MGCECVKNSDGEGRCNSKCGGFNGKSCETNADCKNKNSYTIDQFKKITKTETRYNIDYSKQKGGGVKKESEDDVSNWSNLKLKDDHPNAKQVYYDMKHLYGKPNILVNVKGGIAIWTKEELEAKGDFLHHEIVLRDEAVEHCVPAKHYDFLTSYIKIFIPKDKFLDVTSVSGSVTYDGLKKLLSARCGSLEANYATFVTCLAKLKGENQEYKTNIINKVKNSEENKRIILETLKENKEQYGDKIGTAFYELAFPDGC